MNLVIVLIVLIPAMVALLPLPGWLALRRSRQQGVEFRDLAALQAARGVDTVLLDRWGTVTTGELVVSDIDPIEDGNERNLRWFAAALEHAADDHPVARAIARLAGPGRLTGVESFPGRGISGAVDRHPVRVGSPGWLGMEARDGLGKTIGVEVDHRPFGYLTVTDQVRADAALAVARLRAAGIQPILLSDGTALDTEHLAQACGIDKWLLGKDPAHREELVREQRGRGHTVALVARDDGNAAALAAADLAFTDAAPAVDAETGAEAGAEAGPVPHARLVDLDAQRVAHALELARALPGVVARTRIAGLLITGVGALLAGLGRLNLAGAIGCAALGALVVAVVAVWSLERRRLS
ncbi:HAD family hydrolase [Nocardioides carbamazepini]|uniref:HAD family hydrolase n=1 Tax=Nocardioides carbamazepini TaxID=2854259 RepID=UPI00214A6971|nr:HAD family hydrolase [Nocardioides carbamazepini]MCR1786515.1 HAD family hydrolase [Nocardioides carbamazepini]